MSRYLSYLLVARDQLMEPGDPLYIVIDSGGGFVSSGVEMIGAMTTIKRPIITISKFAFSMAYSISQRGTERLVLADGTMGQHRARATISGYVNDGELEARLDYLRQLMEVLESFEAMRMGITYEEFKKLISTEYYGVGINAVKRGMADQVAIIECSPELMKDKVVSFEENIFGGVSTISISACPLLNIIY